MLNTIRVGLGDSLTVTTKCNKKGREPFKSLYCPFFVLFSGLGEGPDLVLNSRLKCEKLVVSLRESNVRVK